MSNVCRIVQQDLMYRYDPKVKALVVQEVQEVEAHTHEIDEEKAGRGKSSNKSDGDAAPRQPAPTAGSPPKGAQSGSPPKGTQTGKGAGSSSGTGASGGRSRFRDLLAAAAEQQQQRSTASKQPKTGGTGSPGKGTPPAKPASSPASPAPAGSKPSPSTSNGSDASPTTKGSTNGKPTGSAQGQSRSGKPPSKGGHRTNRKRRR
jgi:hypothetical protein